MPWNSCDKTLQLAGRLAQSPLLSGAFVVIAVSGFKRQLLHGAAAYAILPVLPVIGVFAAMGRYLVKEHDEYVRMLMVRQSLWASGFALSLATIWGSLESFELVGHIDAYHIAIVLFLGLGIGSVITKLTLGAPVKC